MATNYEDAINQLTMPKRNRGDEIPPLGDIPSSLVNLAARGAAESPLMRFGMPMLSGMMGGDSQETSAHLEAGRKDLEKKTEPLKKVGAGAVVDTAKVVENAFFPNQPTKAPTTVPVGSGVLKSVVPNESAHTVAARDLSEAEVNMRRSYDSWLGDNIPSLLDKGYTKQQLGDELERRKDKMSPRAYAITRDKIAQTGSEKKQPYEKVESADVEAAKKRIENKATGKGNENGIVEESIETPNSGSSDFETRVGMASSTLMNQIGEQKDWYQDNALGNALLSFGVSMMGGGNIADSLANFTQTYSAGKQVEDRFNMAESLASKGYTNESIMEWIQTNDASALIKPKAQETYSTGKDQYGTYQMNDLTGKKDYFTPAQGKTTWKEATRDVGGQTLYGQENSLGEFKPYNKDFQGSGAGGGSKGGKGPTESQLKATFGYNRAQAANNMWNDRHYGSTEEYPLATITGNVYVGLGDESGTKLAIGTASPKYQQAAGEERTYLAGILRPESGAAVSNSEWTNYGHIFFPRRGDDERKLSQKAWLRDMTALSLAESGVTFTEENEKEVASQIINAMISQAGDVVEYNPNEGVVKLSDGTWYEIQMPNRSY